MAMTRKDYELIADAIASELEQYRNPSALPYLAIESVVYSLSNAFSKENARFNRETFHRACGLENPS